VAAPSAGSQNSASPDKGSQQQSSPNQQQDQQNQIPDAPSTVQPSKPPQEDQPQEAPEAPQSQAPSAPAQPPPPNAVPPASESAPENQNTNPGPPPPLNMKTVPQGGQTKERPTGQDELLTIPVTVNQVVVPVTVKDESGHLVNGLTSKDFSIFESGKKQTLNFFTSDPFALSVAVVLDLGMKDVDLQKVNHTFPALEGAFSQFDEVSLYTYSNAVSQLSGWGAVGQKLDAVLENIHDNVRGQNNGPPVTSGPLGPQGPIINGRPLDPAAPTVYTPVQEAHVLNDALLRAAMDLGRRERNRRKVIFIISDGREYRSTASYRDVLRVLLTNNILVYAIDPGGSALPGYRTLSKLHVPRLGYSDILPKYVNATGGGQVLYELTRTGIEDAYNKALGDARNQYTLGYISHAPPTGGYRTFEVRIERPSCRSSIRPCVDVYAPDGYYPAPPAAR
jgi:VWFA-related protein